MAKISQRDRRFTEYLEELRDGRDGRAAMAALRRTLGKPPGQVPETGRYILRWLPSQLSEWQQAEERAYYLVAALFAWHPIAWHRTEKEKGPTNFGASMRALANQIQNCGPQRRFIAILTCSLAELPEHLRHAVSLLKSQTVEIDWTQLLADIRYWEDEDRRVQSDWARAFWGQSPSESPSGEELETAASSEEEL